MFGEGNSIKDSLPVEAYEEGAQTYLGTSPCGTVHTIGIGRGTYIEILELVDATALIEANTKEANDFSWTAKRGDMVKVASVPTPIRMKMIKEGWDEADVKRWLNDSDNAKFRTTDAKWRV